VRNAKFTEKKKNVANGLWICRKKRVDVSGDAQPLHGGGEDHHGNRKPSCRGGRLGRDMFPKT